MLEPPFFGPPGRGSVGRDAEADRLAAEALRPGFQESSVADAGREAIAAWVSHGKLRFSSYLFPGCGSDMQLPPFAGHRNHHRICILRTVNSTVGKIVNAAPVGLQLYGAGVSANSRSNVMRP